MLNCLCIEGPYLVQEEPNASLADFQFRIRFFHGWYFDQDLEYGEHMEAVTLRGVHHLFIKYMPTMVWIQSSKV